MCGHDKRKKKERHCSDTVFVLELLGNLSFPCAEFQVIKLEELSCGKF